MKIKKYQKKIKKLFEGFNYDDLNSDGFQDDIIENILTSISRCKKLKEEISEIKKNIPEYVPYEKYDKEIEAISKKMFLEITNIFISCLFWGIINGYKLKDIMKESISILEFRLHKEKNNREEI